jgi:adenine-specific DNA methylase
MYNNMFTIATTAIDYYLKKYGKWEIFNWATYNLYW